MSLHRTCTKAGCGVLTPYGKRWCPAHEKKQERPVFAPPAKKESSTKQGYGYRWQKARKAFLAAHPLCQCADCASRIAPLAATVVDHIKPHRGDMVLFWDMNNWQAMAKTCHDKKTAREDGGYGNRTRELMEG